MINSPSFITYHHLSPWLHGNLILVDLIFNFNDPKNDFESKLGDILDCFDGGDLNEYVNFSLIFSNLFRWNQFLVVITTHSDPCTGDLHIAPDNAGAVPVNEVSDLFLFYFYFYFYISEFLNFILDLWCYVSKPLLQYITKRQQEEHPQSIVLWCIIKSEGVQERSHEICFSVHSQLVTNDKLIIWFLFTSNQSFWKDLMFFTTQFPNINHP